MSICNITVLDYSILYGVGAAVQLTALRRQHKAGVTVIHSAGRRGAAASKATGAAFFSPSRGIKKNGSQDFKSKKKKSPLKDLALSSRGHGGRRRGFDVSSVHDPGPQARGPGPQRRMRLVIFVAGEPPERAFKPSRLPQHRVTPLIKPNINLSSSYSCVTLRSVTSLCIVYLPTDFSTQKLAKLG